ncbi:GNAT family N-acetyltransferase [Glaciecola sp. XM2]|jgi:GNAT superfamily N-acetyltransferase|nr:GNAT family N-acetyltransferase [Glaciecola sp. XM2]
MQALELSNIRYLEVNYDDANHASDLIKMLQMYAIDPMGAGEPLSDLIVGKLIGEMRKRPHVFSVLVYADVADKDGLVSDVPIGFCNCIESFSTFKAKAVVNIHDFAIDPIARGHDISQGLIAYVEELSRKRGACKLTLEVLQGNIGAQNAYLKAGFKGYELDPEMGQAMFWEKPL